MSEQPNQDQINFWNSEGGAQWVENQEMMDGNMRVFLSSLLQHASIEPDMQVLDIGCGCGGSTLAAAEAGGNLTGIDISEQMINRARERAEQSTGNIEFLVADAMTYEWPKEYDLIISRFGVMFFEEPVVAFKNLLAALRPGGRICFICWQPAKENPWITVPMSAVRPYLPPAEPPKPGAPGMFGLADPVRTEDILTQAGFENVQCEDVRLDNRMADGTVEGTIQFLKEVGPLRRQLAEVPAENSNKAMADMKQALSENLTDGKVVLGAGCWVVTARKP
jgi:SAM-dependent methyltransferase